MSHPDPKQNFEDEPDDFTITRTEPGEHPGQTRLKPSYQNWLDRLPTKIQESLAKLVWRLHHQEGLSVTHRSDVIDRISEPYDGTLARLARRLKAEKAAFLEEERILEDERRYDPDGTEDGHDDVPFVIEEVHGGE